MTHRKTGYILVTKDKLRIYFFGSVVCLEYTKKDEEGKEVYGAYPRGNPKDIPDEIPKEFGFSKERFESYPRREEDDTILTKYGKVIRGGKRSRQLWTEYDEAAFKIFMEHSIPLEYVGLFFKCTLEAIRQRAISRQYYRDIRILKSERWWESLIEKRQKKRKGRGLINWIIGRGSTRKVWNRKTI